MSDAVVTSYRGYTILVEGDGFTVLDLDGTPVSKHESMASVRRCIARLRRERAAMVVEEKKWT